VGWGVRYSWGGISVSRLVRVHDGRRGDDFDTGSKGRIYPHHGKGVDRGGGGSGEALD
jgi:hypothetical protein